MKVYLDDDRTTPDGWVRAYTAWEVIELLKTGLVTELSLDHDIGDEAVVGNGYKPLEWLEEQVYTTDFNPPKCYVHSANVGAWPKMIAAIESINRRAQG